MPLALQKSTDGGATFQQVSLSAADYTNNGGEIANKFLSVKDSQNNTFILCLYGSGIFGGQTVPFIKIDKDGNKTVINITNLAQIGSLYNDSSRLLLSRDETIILFSLPSSIFSIPTNMLSTTVSTVFSTAGAKFAIYKDQYIWVASGTTVKIYNYDTKVSLDGDGINLNYSILGLSCSPDNRLYTIHNDWLIETTFNGVDQLAKTEYNRISAFTNAKQLLIDRFGDLIILTNTGTASTLLKYSNTGTLIDTVNLSVGTNKGAYGLQVYSSDNGTKCWVQFSNDLGTWRTAETTAQGQAFGAVSKIRDNGVTTYGDDHGGDNNYSVRC